MSAQKQRLMLAPTAQQTVGKNVAALGIGAQLHLIDRQKVTAHPLGHRLDRANPILRPRRDDTFFASHQCHHRRATQSHHTVVNLPRK